MYKRDLHFTVYSPDEEDLYPLVYVLPDSNGAEGMRDVVNKSHFQRHAFVHRLAVVIPEITLSEFRRDQCDDINCMSHRLATTREKTFDLVGEELDYLVSENLPVVKGKQSMLGLGQSSWLALMCALNSPKNYQSVSLLMAERFDRELIPLERTTPLSKKSLQRNLSKHLEIVLDSLVP